jgi:D-glycero-alpha-D-manno-heptose-7-phosphate kinase
MSAASDTVVRASAPVRLDLAGGWTDVPPLSAREGGTVVAAAVELHAHAELRSGSGGFHLISEDLQQELQVPDAGGLAGAGGLDLIRAGLRMLPVPPCTLTTRSDAPPGSGLGSSGAMDVALVAALSRARGETPDVRRIADLACHLEGVEAAIPGGRQDQFMAAYGGFLRLRFNDPEVTIEPLALQPALLDELERRMILVYTGASRFSGATIGRVMQAYERGDPGVAAALHGLREVAERMGPALYRGDLAEVGRLLSRNWRLQQTLDAGMRTETMARLEHAMEDAGVLGGKAAGAGAGGSMFFLGPDDPAPAIAAAKTLGMRLLPVRWTGEGVRWC